jgi:hypothetical protein
VEIYLQWLFCLSNNNIRTSYKLIAPSQRGWALHKDWKKQSDRAYRRYKRREFVAKTLNKNPLFNKINYEKHLISVKIRKIKKYVLSGQKRKNVLSKQEWFLKKHIEENFLPGMWWDNHGPVKKGWKIVYLIPLESAKNKYEITKFSRTLNLTPLWNSYFMQNFFYKKNKKKNNIEKR